MFKRIRALVSALTIIAAVSALSLPSAHAAPMAQQSVPSPFFVNTALPPSSDWQAHYLQRESGADFLIDLLAQPAQAAALSNYWQNHLLDFLLRAQTLTAPATIYVGLDTTAGSASACGTEVTGGSYARVAVTSSLANWAGTQGAGTTTASSGTSGQTSNNAAITFPAPTAAWGTIVGFCFFDASSGGNMLLFAPLTVSKSVNSGDAAPSFAAAALTWTITLTVQPRLYAPAANDDSFRAAA